MRIKKNMHHFWHTFKQPRVSVFLLTGGIVIFLTFLTQNNAIEIAISAVASVFIGIGVNNFSAFETHLKDQQKLQSRMQHAKAVLAIVKEKSSRLKKEDFNIEAETMEIQQLVDVCMHLLDEDNQLL